MSWRIARSIDTLRRQVNARWPNRDKASDGTIGDAKHSSRKSDHNPNSLGVVCAIDIDKDLSPTEKVDVVVNALVNSRDPRIKYIIWRGQILSSIVQPWVWRRYTGANGHFEHMHLSVSPDPNLYDDPREWNLGGEVVPMPSEPDLAGRRFYEVRPGDHLWKIAGSFKVPISDIMALNPQITNPDFLKVGDKIRVR